MNKSTIGELILKKAVTRIREMRDENPTTIEAYEDIAWGERIEKIRKMLQTIPMQRLKNTIAICGFEKAFLEPLKEVWDEEDKLKELKECYPLT